MPLHHHRCHTHATECIAMARPTHHIQRCIGCDAGLCACHPCHTQAVLPRWYCCAPVHTACRLDTSPIWTLGWQMMSAELADTVRVPPHTGDWTLAVRVKPLPARMLPLGLMLMPAVVRTGGCRWQHTVKGAGTY
jgi:hypothetical protein